MHYNNDYDIYYLSLFHSRNGMLALLYLIPFQEEFMLHYGSLNLQYAQQWMFCRPCLLLAREWCLTSEQLQRRAVFLFINQLESNSSNSSNKQPTIRLYNCNISNNRQQLLYLPHVRIVINFKDFHKYVLFIDGSTALTIPRYQ